MLSILKQIWLNLTTDRHMSSFWYPSADVDAQCAHVTTAIAIVLSCILLHKSLLFGCIAALVWAIFKEFIFDFAVEADSDLNSFIDFSFYLVGIVISILLVVFYGH